MPQKSRQARYIVRGEVSCETIGGSPNVVDPVLDHGFGRLLGFHSHQVSARDAFVLRNNPDWFVAPCPFASASCIFKMFSVSLLAIARRANVVFVAFAFQDVYRIAIKGVSNFLFQASKAINGRLQKLGKTLTGVLLFLLPGVTVLVVVDFGAFSGKPRFKFLDIFFQYSSPSPIAVIPAVPASIIGTLIIFFLLPSSTKQIKLRRRLPRTK
mmetsp:Transcript_7828/g.19443  ORF Transcript_7828/g.19443 Transcript_7828/m.19443 type:complete len:212 (+) Transcript_7828:722-1357(+)